MVSAVLHCIQMDVGQPADQLGQAGQLEVVGGEEGSSANLAAPAVRRRAVRQREAVVGAGAEA